MQKDKEIERLEKQLYYERIETHKAQEALEFERNLSYFIEIPDTYVFLVLYKDGMNEIVQARKHRTYGTLHVFLSSDDVSLLRTWREIASVYSGTMHDMQILRDVLSNIVLDKMEKVE